MAPIEASQRFATLDLLRGLALFGVLIVNLLYFFRLSLFDHILRFHSHPGRVNHAIDWVVSKLLEFKAFDLFSLTFGIGLAIQAERAKSRDTRVEPFLVRRFLVLLVFGVLHIVFISNVDILCLYAVCGLLLIPLLRVPAAFLALAGLAAVYLPSAFSGFTSFPTEPVLRGHVVNATRIYSQGSFAEIVEFRWHETRQLILPLLIGVAQKSLGMMLLGVAVWRSGVIRQPERYRRLLWALSLGAGLIGVAFRSDIYLAFAYAAALLAWRRSNRIVKITAPVAAAGQMAFTNYLAQSLVFGTFFYGYGFGLFGRLDPATAAAIGVTVYAGQLWLSSWWLKRYRFGPFEWIWRSLTYGWPQPMHVTSCTIPECS